MKKALFILLIFSQLIGAQLPQARGVWLSRDVIEGGVDLIESTCHKLAQANFNRIFVNVYYLGATIYPSDVLQQAGGPRQHIQFVGRDPLAETIEIAHRWNLEVIAWFEYGLMSHYSGNDTSDSGPILTAHPDWEAIDNQGRHYQQNQWGVFHWMDAAHPEVKQFMEDLFAEIAARYPQLDGVETDRIRYPSTDFSYSAVSRQRYQRQTGGTDPLYIYPEHAEWAQWTAWRESQINQIARRIYQTVKALQPDMLVSAAVAPPYMLLSGSKLQRWDVWSDSGYVDALEHMLYLNDSDFPNQFELARQKTNPRVLLYAGIDFNTLQSALFQINYALTHQADGVTIWYYKDLNDEVLQTLRDEVFKTKAALPHQDLIIDDGASRFFTATGAWDKYSGGFNDSYLLSADPAAQAVFDAPVWLSGHYALFARWPAQSDLTEQALWRIEANGSTHSVTIDQQKDANRWVFLHADSFSFGSTVRLQLNNSANGKLAADAVRLLRQKPLKAIDYFAPDSVHLNLKFNQWIDSAAALSPANYNIQPQVEVINVAFVGQDRSAVSLQTAPLTPGQTYQLQISALKDYVGIPLNDLTLSFTFDPQSSEIVIDNASDTFTTYGQWQPVADSCAINGAWLYIQAGSGARFAQWWSPIQQDGYYRAQVFIPCSDRTLASDAHYAILHNFGSSSVILNQQQAAGNWADLGTYYLKTGQTASVKLSDEASAGVIAADALRFKRTLNLTALPQHNEPLPDDFTVGANYPNPFNNQTLIPLHLNLPAKVRLELFDVRGRRVFSSAERVFPAGEHRLTLKAEQLSSGIYFFVVRFRTADHRQKAHYGKVMVLK